MKKYYLTKEQEEMRKEVELVAKDCGLDFFPTNFINVNFEDLGKIVANGGFPVRYNHWQFGMEYERQITKEGYGFSRIFELVINNNPAIAYLSNANLPIHQKMVMAHVYAHVDFFKNNYMFDETNRNMVNAMAEHAQIVKRAVKKVGEERVEKFLDACLSLTDLIDGESVRIKKRYEQNKDDDDCEENSCDASNSCATCKGCSSSSCDSKPKYLPGEEYRIKTKRAYMDDFVNTPEFLEKQKRKAQAEKVSKKNDPPEPERDILLYVLENSESLKNWQKDILSFIRKEMYYFYPQGATKIMNEGWATYWHNHIMLDRGLVGDEGLIEFAKANAMTLNSSGGINPYQIGFALFRSVKERWDKGKHGRDYELETNYLKRKQWDTKEGKGLEKIFEVRKTRNDIEFLREFMTDDFIRDELFYTFKLDKDDNWYKIASKDPKQIKQTFLNMLTNHGMPIIKAINGNYGNKKELMLKHSFDGKELDIHYTRKTLESLYQLWGRPVYMYSFQGNGLPKIFRFDGKEHKIKDIGKK